MSDYTFTGPSAVARGRTHWPKWVRVTTALSGIALVGAVAAWVLIPRAKPERAAGAAAGGHWTLGKPMSVTAPAPAPAPVAPRQEPTQDLPGPLPAAPPPPIEVAEPMDSWGVPGGGERTRTSGRDPAAGHDNPAVPPAAQAADASEYARRMQSTKFGPLRPTPVRLPPSYTIPPGRSFDCVPPSPISSEMVGSVKCLVQGNVWSMDDSTILIPDQSTAHGTIERGLQNGERRLWITWHYAMTPKPDFQMIPLEAPAADEMGQMGVPGDINTRFWERLSTTFVLSGVEFLTGAGVAAVQDGARNVFNFGGAASGLGRSTNSLAEKAFDRDKDIPVTLARGPARTLKVYINRPINLELFYRNVVIRR